MRGPSQVKRQRAPRLPRFYVWREIAPGRVVEVMSGTGLDEAAAHGAELLNVPRQDFVMVSSERPFTRPVGTARRFMVTATGPHQVEPAA